MGSGAAAIPGGATVSETDKLLLEVAGLLTLIAQGARPVNLDDQAQGLLDKIGAAIGRPPSQGVQP